MCSDLVDLVELLNIVPEGKTANDVAANLAKVAEFVINTYEASGADDDMATCSGSALTKSGVTENWQRMFVSYGEGLGDGTLYQQAKTSDFFDAEHCIWGGSEDTVTKLADFFYAQSTESQVQSMRDFLKLSVVVNKLDLLPKKYADAWNSDEKDEDEGDEDEGDEDVFAILKELEGQDIDKSVHYAPFDGPEGYPDVQLNAEETEMLRRFMIAAQGNYIVAGIIDQEAMTHLKTTSLKSLLSAKSGSLGAASANVRPAVLALRWMTLSKTEMRREW